MRDDRGRYYRLNPFEHIGMLTLNVLSRNDHHTVERDLEMKIAFQGITDFCHIPGDLFILTFRNDLVVFPFVV